MKISCILHIEFGISCLQFGDDYVRCPCFECEKKTISVKFRQGDQQKGQNHLNIPVELFHVSGMKSQ